MMLVQTRVTWRSVVGFKTISLAHGEETVQGNETSSTTAVVAAAATLLQLLLLRSKRVEADSSSRLDHDCRRTEATAWLRLVMIAAAAVSELHRHIALSLSLSSVVNPCTSRPATSTLCRLVLLLNHHLHYHKQSSPSLSPSLSLSPSFTVDTVATRACPLIRRN